MFHFQRFDPPVATDAILHALDGIILIILPLLAF